MIENKNKSIVLGHLPKSVVQTGLSTSSYQLTRQLEDSQVSYQILVSGNKNCEQLQK